MVNLCSEIGRGLRALRTARGGNVAITFAFASIPVLGFIGAGFDYSHANAVKTDMQAALDSTALMLAKDATTLSNDDLQIKALAYFTAMFNRPEATIDSIHASYTTDGGSAVKVWGSVDVPTTFIQALNVLGLHALDNITLNGSSTTKWGNTLLRVALVLDNTGSMAQNGKMNALKTATKNLLTQLKNAATNNGDVYVSIIPFSKDVNVGSQNYNANWIGWTDWNSNNQTCTGGGNDWGNGWGWGWGNQTCTPKNHNTWNGCITDRGTSSGPSSQNYDQNATAPDPSIAASLFPAEQYSSCPVAMKGLNYDWTSMNSLVDSMQPNGNTNQPVGLVWGWQSLVGGGPLEAPPKNSNYTYQQAIILLSDGLNTQNRWSSSQSQIDKRMYDSSNGLGTCANIKAAGITIYTIQVNTNGDPTSTLLQNCASSSDKFFLLTSAGEIVTVFQQIGTNLTKLRVAL
jgi:Flp pilus assembly protein TadG